jgi:hypothetical protein
LHVGAAAAALSVTAVVVLTMPEVAEANAQPSAWPVTIASIVAMHVF